MNAVGVVLTVVAIYVAFVAFFRPKS